MSWAEFDRVDGEIATLGARAVAEIAHLVFGAGIGRQLGRVELVAHVVGVGVEAHIVEHEELRFRAHEHGVGGLGLLDIGLGQLGRHARVAGIGLAGGGLEDIAEQAERRLGVEGIDMRRRRIGHQRHVGFVDRLPAGDGRAVEHLAFGEGVLTDEADIEGDVLQLAARVGEAQIDELDVLVLDEF